jgi:hypothetical protein
MLPIVDNGNMRSFQLTKHVNDQYHVDGFGEVVLRPIIQTCMMYACIETNGSNEDPN